MKCLYPPCQKKPKSRGLCNNHLHVARSLVKEKKTNWTELERLGKATKPQDKIGPVVSWFMSKEGLPKTAPVEVLVIQTEGSVGIGNL